jgi:hypothetical protein
MDVGSHLFLYNRGRVERVLGMHSVLGAHSSVVSFAEGKVTTYTWAHPIFQPFGERVSRQCTVCRCLDTLVKKFVVVRIKGAERAMPESITFKIRCKAKVGLGKQKTQCSFSKVYKQPEGSEWLQNTPAGADSTGGWLKSTSVHSISNT